MLNDVGDEQVGILGWVIRGPVGAEIRLPEVAIHVQEEEKKGEEDTGKEGGGGGGGRGAGRGGRGGGCSGQ